MIIRNVFRVNRKKFESVKPIVKGREVLAIANLLPVEDYELLIKVNEKGFEPIQLDEEIDLKGVGIEGFFAKPYKKLIICVDDKPVEVDECFMTPKEIMIIAGINPDRYFLNELRSGGVEVTFKDDLEHKIAITKKSCFASSEIEVKIECVIVNAREKVWSSRTISFEDIVKLAYGEVSTNPNVIYTVNYKRGAPSKPEGSMVKGEVISVKNKMIFNVTQTNKS